MHLASADAAAVLDAAIGGEDESFHGGDAALVTHAQTVAGADEPDLAGYQPCVGADVHSKRGRISGRRRGAGVGRIGEAH